ncbi:hypothetical protein BDW22DRAFT_1343690 [Trametopsis cervina]|nr:hypothetical protein BDW22DRAFT_1343690 [Trametopsis cervina]
MNATRIWNCLAKWRSHEWCDVTGENQDLYRAQRVDKDKIAVNPLECSPSVPATSPHLQSGEVSAAVIQRRITRYHALRRMLPQSPAARRRTVQPSRSFGRNSPRSPQAYTTIPRAYDEQRQSLLTAGLRVAQTAACSFRADKAHGVAGRYREHQGHQAARTILRASTFDLSDFAPPKRVFLRAEILAQQDKHRTQDSHSYSMTLHGCEAEKADGLDTTRFAGMQRPRSIRPLEPKRRGAVWGDRGRFAFLLAASTSCNRAASCDDRRPNNCLYSTRVDDTNTVPIPIGRHRVSVGICGDVVMHGRMTRSVVYLPPKTTIDVPGYTSGGVYSLAKRWTPNPY